MALGVAILQKIKFEGGEGVTEALHFHASTIYVKIVVVNDRSIWSRVHKQTIELIT